MGGWKGGDGVCGGYSQALLVNFMYTGRHMSYRQPVVLCAHFLYMYFLVNTTEKILCACILLFITCIHMEIQI